MPSHCSNTAVKESTLLFKNESELWDKISKVSLRAYEMFLGNIIEGLTTDKALVSRCLDVVTKLVAYVEFHAGGRE
jgi:hypothetical protein